LKYQEGDIDFQSHPELFYPVESKWDAPSIRQGNPAHSAAVNAAGRIKRQLNALLPPAPD
jgi:hypothetical protein